MRQVVLDTETTGLEPERGHRVIDIGAVELVDRERTGRQLQHYLDPGREIDDAAFGVHGLDAEFLAGKPKFADIADELVNFIDGAEVIIHNAAFDLAFIDYEFSLLERGDMKSLRDICTVTDSMELARRKHPGQHNGLPALCRRYDVDDSTRDLHSALLDAEILADVYLKMTGGQISLFSEEDAPYESPDEGVIRLPDDRPRVPVRRAKPEELNDHEAYLDGLDAEADGGSVWRRGLRVR